MHELCLRHGEDHLAAVLIPLAVDGIIVVASMSILLSNRYGSRGGALAWTLLVVGSLASLGANIAVAGPGLVGRIIAAWPSIALIGSYELLMSQIRRVSWNTGRQPPEPRQDDPPGKAWWVCIGRRGGGRERTAGRTGRSPKGRRSPNASSAAPARPDRETGVRRLRDAALDRDQEPEPRPAATGTAHGSSSARWAVSRGRQVPMRTASMRPPRRFPWRAAVPNWSGCPT
ncbi:DUF2637 domain-containing protein [Streptosporangium saharense]|uniref:DUF2637 domain-containing protein n=1 Tax=Streptosporangium saharense TaxID=1706840 RepID=UPI0034474757